MSEEERRLAYQQTVATRSAEVSAHWARYNIQIVLNSTVLFGYLAIGRPEVAGNRDPVILLGATLVPIWAWINHRGNYWMNFWNERLSAIEAGPPPFPPVFSEAIRRTWRGATVAALTTLIPVVFALAWMLLAYQVRRRVYAPTYLSITIGAFVATLLAFAYSLPSDDNRRSATAADPNP